MEIRKATSQDAPVLSQICASVQTLHVDNRPDVFKPVPRNDFAVSFFKETLLDHANTCWLASMAGKDLGYCVATLRERPADEFTYGRRTLHIDQLGVLSEVKGQGIGQALMVVAEAFAFEHQVNGITLGVWAFNAHAIGFYEHLGYQIAMHSMWKAL
jgi:ribosomal protein S18 acetylase RimI-like enzyme